jgi:hypothetical protein
MMKLDMTAMTVIFRRNMLDMLIFTSLVIFESSVDGATVFPQETTAIVKYSPQIVPYNPEFSSHHAVLNSASSVSIS